MKNKTLLNEIVDGYMQGCTVRKAKLDKIPMNDLSISKDSLGVIESLKPPFETTDEFINRLVNLQKKYHQKKGKEFVHMVFQEDFLMCSHEFFQEYNSKSKKKHGVNETRKKIKESIRLLFEENENPVLALLLLLDESVTLLFQTEFYEQFNSYENNFEEDIEDNMECIEVMN